MSELTEFLLARIAEDEAVAKKASHQKVAGPLIGWNADSAFLTTINTGFDRGERDHIARHDPARVLRECVAKRRIIEFHEQWPVLVETPPKMETVPGDDPQRIVMRASQQIQWMTQQEYRARFGDEPPTTPMLRAMAAVYADHPDFDPAWA